MQNRGDKELFFKRAAYSLALALFVFGTPSTVHAQVNSGSDGHDGAFNPTTNTVINMIDHPDGIYHYTSINIPSGVIVSFVPNGKNTPVVWLVQENCSIDGSIDLNGQSPIGVAGGIGGPGGYCGGTAQLSGSLPSVGFGPGGGNVSTAGQRLGGNASFAEVGEVRSDSYPQHPAGETYGTKFLLPLLGGSGGSGSSKPPLPGNPVGYDSTTYPIGSAGGGGGGAILIAANQITLNGSIKACGGGSNQTNPGGGGGSGGGIRLVASRISGNGSILAAGGQCRAEKFIGSPLYFWAVIANNASRGWVRLDSLENMFSGAVSGVLTIGFQPIILLPANQTVGLTIQSIGEIAVGSNPRGQLIAPDVIVPGNQQNPVPIVLRCANIPLNTEIIVEVKPANGQTIRAVGMNNTGTLASSIAVVSVNMPRGGGTIQAKAVSGIADNLYGVVEPMSGMKSLALTGLTADGERFLSVEVTAALGGQQKLVYLTKSGKRYSMPTL